MPRKLFETIGVNFDANFQILIIYSVFVKYLRMCEYNVAVNRLFIDYKNTL